MQITTTFRQMPASAALREYAESKMTRLEKYFHGIIEVRVTFSAGKTSQTAEVTVNANGSMVRGTESAEDAYSALDLVVDKLSRQLRKLHDKVKSHKAAGKKAEVVEAVLAKPKGRKRAKVREDAEDVRDSGITSRATYSLEPIFPEDAIAQLEQSAWHFLVFVNAETQSVNVVYRRPDGKFGLVEPD